MSEINWNTLVWHPKFTPLLTVPHTIADIHGGRYGMKTENVHRLAIYRALHEQLRIVGARETLESTKDSSIKTISDIIHSHNMAVSQNGPFEVLRDSIRRVVNGRVLSEFMFIGVRENIRDKKSLANIDLAIFDEAGKCSSDTLNVFLPTIIRKKGCQGWFIWNPESTVDPIYKWLNGDPGPSNCLHIETSYKDNPWLSDEALQLIADCKRDDPELYEHLYGGKAIDNVKGGIFEAEMKAADAEGRITRVPYNRLKPVFTSWDLGMDTTAIWFVQPTADGLNFIDFYQNKGQDLAHYLIELNRREYVYGRDHLPFDAVDAIIHRNGMMGKNPDRSATIQTMMRDAGRNVSVGPKLLKADRIRAVRSKFPVCRFDADNCKDGIFALKNYQWDRDESKPGDDKTKGERKELHNWASHASTSFMEACVNVKEIIKRVLPVAHTGRAHADV